MFSNILPFICSNTVEFTDERNCLREITFPKLRNELQKLTINFDPFDFDWTENDDYVKSGTLLSFKSSQEKTINLLSYNPFLSSTGHLLRMLLHNIKKTSPFFICLVGEQYGTYLDEANMSPSGYTLSAASKARSLNWIEKNLHVASQTGYYHLINQFQFHDSFLEYQINAALLDEANYPYYRFYFRQSEYLETKFEHLSIEERREAFRLYEVENEYCARRVKELKLRVAKKGIVIRYYKSLEQLHELVYEDVVELIQEYLKANLKLSNKTKLDWAIEVLQAQKLGSYVVTDTLQSLLVDLDGFCRNQAQRENSGSSQSSKSDECGEAEKEQLLRTEEYREILRLRHASMSK